MRKGLWALLFLFTLSAVHPVTPANAQLFKKMFKKKRNGRKERHDRDSEKSKGKNKHFNESAKEDDRSESKEDKKSKREQRKREKEERKRLQREQKAAKKKKNEAAKKKDATPVKETTAKPAKAARAVIAERKNEVSYPATEIKTHYRVDVVTPLYLDEMVQGGSVTFRDHMPDKAAPGLAFYQGVKLAADSLQKAGFNMDIYLHDAGSINESVDNLVGKHLLDSSDLIIGAVTGHDIPGLAAYAKNYKINFVSALSAADGNVKDNAFFTVLQPTLKSQCEWIVKHLSAKYAGQKVALLYRTAIPAEENAYKYITTATDSKVQFSRLLCNATPTYEALNTLFDSVGSGVVVMAMLDTTFADSIMRRMSKDFPVNHFEVYGMPSWYGMHSLSRSGIHKNIAVHVTHGFNINMQSAGVASLAAKFKREFGGKPSEIVLRGYETTMWYASLLKKYGTIFNQQYGDVSGAPFSAFDVKPQFDKHGFMLFNENRKVYHSIYEAGELKSTE